MTQCTHSTFSGRSFSRCSSWPLPMTRNGISGASRAASRIVSSPCSGISLPTNRLGRSCASGASLGGRAGPQLPRSRLRLSRAESPHFGQEISVGPRVLTTRSAVLRAFLSTAASARAVNERDEYRPRSLTMVSCETSGLKTSGRPPAALRARGMSKWPGYPTSTMSYSFFGGHVGASASSAAGRCRSHPSCRGSSPRPGHDAR